MRKNRLFLTLALAALMFAACPTGDDGGGPVTPPNTVLASGGGQVTITGNTAYYYDPATVNGREKGVFIEGRTVTLSPFYIAKYETTYELWYEVYRWATDASRGTDIYNFANQGREGDDGSDGAEPTEAKNEPVTGISWRDAIVWCNAYSEKSGKTPVYRDGSDAVLRDSSGTAADGAVMKEGAKGWRLPTEAEWEYAARGGKAPSTSSPFTDKWAGTNDQNALGNYAWYGDNSYNKGSSDPDYGTHAVGTRTANSLGLYDMSGNVWEWCWDRDDTVSGETVTDPKGPATGADRVVRGGGWSYDASFCAVAYRISLTPGHWRYFLGFRLVLCP